MANPNSLLNGQGAQLPLLLGVDGTGYLQAAGDSPGTPTGADNPSAAVLTQTIKAGTASRSAPVGLATTDVTLLAANALRKGATFYNTSTAILYLALGSGATSGDYTLQLPMNGYYELPFGYRGIVTGIWAGGVAGVCLVTELT